VIGNLVWGPVLDRLAVFWAMAGAVALWSAASAVHAFASGFLGFAAARCLLGFAEGVTFPGAVRTVVQTLPASSRSRGIAVAYSGGSLGALLTPLLVTPIAAYWGWRAAFWATGAIGAVWLLAWLLQRRRPDLAAPPRPQTGADRPERGLRWTDPRLWSFLSICAAGGLPAAFVLYAAPLYLGGRLGMSQTDLGRVLWVPPLGAEVGYFFWGWAADRLTARSGSLPAGRLFALLAVLSLPLACTTWLGSTGLVVGALFLAMFIGGGSLIAALSYGTDVLPTARSGLVAGLASASWSMVVAVAMPFFGRMFDQGRYTTAFAAAAGAPVLGFLAWLVLSSWTRSRDVHAGSPGRLRL
jgi:ACS family hexuronate transporter-like MFS transporter